MVIPENGHVSNQGRFASTEPYKDDDSMIDAISYGDTR